MTGLRILDLSSNNFSGSLPANYSDIPNLEVLDLGDNSLVGELPSSWNSW
ncbi:MAG: leucine-rich repeat domain-containing protein [Candidatus Peribacteria bacterium]|nr:MAG: leucine-rich repeat domain-containing protein [Candidatus Peribacteria bacterium]